MIDLITTFWPVIFTVGGIHLLALISPGPDFFFVSQQALQSRFRGIVASAGIAMGIALHVLYSLAGIGLIIKSSILLFTFIKICGGVYLVYLGFKSFLSHTKNSQDSKLISAQNSGSNFKIKDLLLKGFLTNALNPKVTMFFFMIFSQFIDPNTPFLLQVIIGLETILLTFVWFVFVSFILSTSIIQKPFLRFSNIIDKIFGGILISLGLKVILDK